MQKYLYAIRRFKIKPWIKYYLLKDTKNVLPNTYQQVEYIQLSGEQYIDTNYALWANTNWKIEYKFDVNEFYNYNNVIGVLETSDSNSNEIWITSNSRYYIRFTDVGRTSLGILELNTPYTIIHDNTGNNLLNYVNGELVKTSNKANTSLDYKLGLGHREGANYLKGKIYYAKFWNGNKLVRNFIPCYRKSDNVAGMYDTVNGVFYTNEGTGDFIVGEDVLPNTYQEVEYLEASGTQYIDTGYAFTEPELKIVGKYRKTSTLGRNVFGIDLWPNTPRKIHGNIYNKALYLGNSSVVTNITQALNEDYIFEFEFKNNVAKWIINGIEYTYNGANGWEGVSDGETDYLFASRGLNGPGYVFTGRIYYAKFYDNNGDLVRNFVPCYRKSDDKPGMYDTINNVFYTNEGDGEFNVGSEV